MARIACAGVVLALAVLAPPAAAFEICERDGTTVTATFGSATTGTLRQSGAEIRADGVQCDGATTANTDRIDVVGDGDHEVLTIDLSGGTFAGGVTDEAGTSDEIEIEVDFGEASDPAELGDSFFPQEAPELIVVGSDVGADRVTGGTSGPGLPRSDRFTVLNLDASDDDVDVTVADRRFVEVRGRGGADVLSAAGGNGGGSLSGDPLMTLRGGAGDDDLTAGYALPGPGDDTVRVASTFTTIVSYFDAPGGVTIAGGSGTAAGQDGEVPAGTDTFVGNPRVVGSDAGADTFNAAAGGSTFHGAGNDDTFNGGPALDWFDGGAGSDTLHGAGDEDWLFGGPGDDALHGEGGADDLDGQGGDDDEFGGPGGDFFDQYGTGFGAVAQPGPNGADELHGGPDEDVVGYGNANEFDDDSTAVGVGRTSGVRISPDDVADDGAEAEGDNVHSDIEHMAGGRGADTIVGSAVANFILGFDGGDTVMVRGGGADTVNCGAGDDLVRADASDTAEASCDRVELTDPPPPDPPAQPPADPPADPPFVPPLQPPVQPPAVVPPAAAPPVSTLLTLPSSRRCASRRKFTVRVRREIRGTVKRLTIFLNGRRVKSVTGSRIGLPIDLRGLPKGKVKVRLRVELDDGRVATDTRTYRTCATKKRKGQFGRGRRG